MAAGKNFRPVECSRLAAEAQTGGATGDQGLPLLARRTRVRRVPDSWMPLFALLASIAADAARHVESLHDRGGMHLAPVSSGCS